MSAGSRQIYVSGDFEICTTNRCTPVGKLQPGDPHRVWEVIKICF